jgi:hypothetical protein
MSDGRVIAGDLPAVVHSGVEKAIGIQHSAVAGYVQRLRRGRPAATPADIIATLEKQYLAAVTSTGAAMGGVAAAPGAGTGLALALSAGETAVFLETTALFTLAVAEVHAVPVEDAERRRDVVLTVVLGDGGAMLVEKAAGRTGERWAKLLADLIPMSSISAINKALCHWLMNQYPRNHGALVLGKILPFGIGAGIAAAGNHAFGRMVVSASRRVFGPPPASFAGDAVTIVDTPAEALDAVVPSPRTEVRDDKSPATEQKTPAEQKPAPEQPAPEQKPAAEQPATEQPAPEQPAPEQQAPEPTPAAEQAPAPEQQAPEPTPAAGQATGKQPAPVTGKYRPLFDHLVSQGTDRVDLRFADIDALVTGGLPKSASTTKTWWSNTPSSRQAKAWLAADYEVVTVDLRSKTVQFARRARP